VRCGRCGGTNERNEADRDSIEEVSAGNPASIQLGKLGVVEGLRSVRQRTLDFLKF
jgi:hypothetical protein